MRLSFHSALTWWPQRRETSYSTPLDVTDGPNEAGPKEIININLTPQLHVLFGEQWNREFEVSMTWKKGGKKRSKPGEKG